MMSTYYLRGGLALPLNSRHDPAKKGILGILTDDRPRKREASEVGESLNFFTLGSLEKTGQVYDSIEGVLEHLARWQSELEAEGLLGSGSGS
jgi:hypothetical protein